MEFIKSGLLMPGDPTLCTPLDFVTAVRKTSPKHQHTTAEQMQERYTIHFESMPRYEYRVLEDGKLIAIMVFTCVDQEVETGGRMFYPTIVQSLKPGVLSGGYRWLFELAKKHNADFVLITKSKGYSQSEKTFVRTSKGYKYLCTT
ncbi:hypothetical protein K3712_000548 [Escherichia coli]|nr:hypothetical protein [Escherichia coli]